MTSVRRLIPLAVAAWFAGGVSHASAPKSPAENAEALEFFEKKIRPILVNNCYTCHSADTNSKGGLRVDDLNGLLDGGNSGPAVVPGHPEESLLVQVVRQVEGPKMPPKKKLADDEIASLERWIKEGAAWPSTRGAGTVAVAKANPKYEQLRKNHWSLQPVKKAAPPKTRDASWPKSDVDRFLLAKLEAEGLKPSADADRTSLIRRLSFDLTGLPPTPEEIDAFVQDRSADAVEKLVDRLVASPAFGQHWARHWLDVARYGESTGASRNLPYPHAWRYRDYVVDAFTKDKPYDQFLREQIAGDLLPAKTRDEKDEHTVATGFLALGVKDVNQRFKVRFVMDNVDEQIDTVGRAILATTVGCARCHDHKFDPIPQSDYYALAGIFVSTDNCAGLRNKMGGGGLDYYDTNMLLPIGDPPAKADASAEKIAELTKRVKQAQAEFIAIRDSGAGSEKGPDGRPKQMVARQKWNKLQEELLALNDPANRGKIAFGVREAKKITDTEIRLRGEAEKRGALVPRGFLSAIRIPNQPKIDPKSSGRLELAQYLTSPDNPLTSRVFVNRVWAHLFGAGLVRSVDNFGVTGDAPSHPELLDYLAAKFVAEGWSTKKLVRSLVLTRAYGLSSHATRENLDRDPSNRLVWRHAPRRLQAEEIRDATLAASGKLDPSAAQASPASELKVIELPNNGPLARKLTEAARASRRRSVFLPLVRGVTPISLDVFDFAEQGTVTGKRDTTTVAPQALYLLNDSFVRGRALETALRVLSRTDLNDRGRLNLAYRLVLGRPANESEIIRAGAFLADYEREEQVLLASRVEEPKPSPKAEPEPAKPDAKPAKGEAKKPAPPVNPDEVVQQDAPVVEEAVVAPDARTAAWAGFCQVLLGSAEFRYVP